jgi:hypothetical protein
MWYIESISTVSYAEDNGDVFLIVAYSDYTNNDSVKAWITKKTWSCNGFDRARKGK